MSAAQADWRERKKAATRGAIQQHALRLFLDKGYNATTVEEIAAAAGVSHMTFFRHFPRKEDVVESDDYDPLIIELIAAGNNRAPRGVTSSGAQDKDDPMRPRSHDPLRPARVRRLTRNACEPIGRRAG